MERQPRTRSARSLDRAVLARAFGFLGPVEAVASLVLLPVGAALFFGWRPGTPLPAGGPALATLSTMVFAAIVLAQMANAFECRSSRLSLRTIGLATNRLLVGAVAVEGLTLLGFVYLRPVRAVLGHQPLTLAQWLPVLAAPVLLFAAEEARKAVIRRHRAVRHPANRPDDPEAPDRPRLALADEHAGPDEVRRDERQVDLPSLGGSR